jgi:hypothetical protein
MYTCMYQKRPTPVSEEAYTRVNRDSRMRVTLVKRALSSVLTLVKRALSSVKRDLNRQETYTSVTLARGADCLISDSAETCLLYTY